MCRALAFLTLCAIAPAALAQPDPGCTWPEPAISLRRPSGSVSILHVKYPPSVGFLDCKKTTKDKDGCRNPVEVKMFKRREGGGDACCYRIDWAEMRVKNKNKDVPIRWTLASVDNPKVSYEFTADAIEIGPPPPLRLNDFGALTLETLLTPNDTAKLIAINARKENFNYHLLIERVFPGGTRMACDKVDPLIGNQGQ